VGPTDIPIRNNNIVIPKDVPLKDNGADTKEILKAPISANDNPIAITESSTAITYSVEWYIKSKKNPIVLIILPITVGFIFPVFDMRNPDKTDMTKETIINGSWTLAAATGPPPNPNGDGLCIIIGRDWYIINIEIPIVIIKIFVGKSIVSFNN
jgi:hypothetical protein